MVLALGLVWLFAYKFPVGKPIDYHLTVSLDGYLPVLGVGEGKATVEGVFEVVGKNGDSATSTLKEFSAKFNEGKLPLTLDDARAYFPIGTFKYKPEGLMTSWDGVGKAAPIRFPGIDVEHLPEVVFMPILWADRGLATSESGGSFTRGLTAGKGDYTYGPGRQSGVSPRIIWTFPVTCRQTYSTFEDAANQVVAEKDAVAKVDTVVTGKGTLVFEAEAGRIKSFDLDELSTGKATDLASKKVTDRKLKIHVSIRATTPDAKS